MNKRLQKRILIAVATAVLAVMLTALVLECGRAWIKRNVAPWSPDYGSIGLFDILDDEELTDSDYDILYRQTGLTRVGIDGLIAADRVSQIYNIQDDFFNSGIVVASNMPLFVTSFDRVMGHYEYPELEDGDIVISFSTYFSAIELGHAAIVVDAQLGLLAETTGYDSPFGYVNAADFFTNSTYAVLRPMCDSSIKEAAVRCATEELLGTRYDILTGIFTDKAPDTIRTTHCSHSVWYAYMRAGLDLDSNGGKIVTPRDILNSEHLTLVGSRGMDIYGIFSDR